MAGNDWKWPVFKKRSFWTLQVISGWLFTHQQVVSSLLYDIIKAQRRRICQIPKKFDQKNFFANFFWKFFFWKFFLKNFFLWFFKMFYFLHIWVVFWYIQGAEVKLGVINCTSAPCTYQKNVSGVSRMKYWCSIFQKSKKTRPNKSSKSVKNWIFTREVIFGHFRSLPVRFFCTKKLSQVYSITY